MLTSQRKKHLLDLLSREGRIVAKTTSEQLGVSEDTIRRDLRELAKDGLLRRVHGGALPLTPPLVMFADRHDIEPGAKAEIGRAAAALVQPGQVVCIDGGTTCLQMVRQLPPDLQATVITHSASNGHSAAPPLRRWYSPRPTNWTRPRRLKLCHCAKSAALSSIIAVQRNWWPPMLARGSTLRWRNRGHLLLADQVHEVIQCRCCWATEVLERHTVQVA